MERGCYFLRTLPPEDPLELPEEPREPPEEPRETDPPLREDEPRETLPDRPEEDEPRDTLPDLPTDDEPVRLPLDPIDRPEGEDGREYGPLNVRARARPLSP